MALSRSLQWMAGIVLALGVLALLVLVFFDWNWLRGPIERMTLEKTGRVLAIRGPLTVHLGWPWPRIQADAVAFANPDWAREKQMVTADAVEITVDLPQLLRRKLVFTDVWLKRPVVFLEQAADGRKSWLLDRRQQDEEARIQIDRLALDQGSLGYDDAAQKTHIRSELSSAARQTGGATDLGVAFRASGHYKGQLLRAQGSGGPVLAIRDEVTPYPVKVDATIGATSVRVDGTVTSLLALSGVDLRLAVRGGSMDQLYPLLGIALPSTRPYVVMGHLLHSGASWRLERFSGRVGASDLAGRLEVDTAGQRPTLEADVRAKVLDLADLGPVIGARPVGSGSATGHVLPDLPFQTERWRSVDADVRLRAKTLKRAKALPLDDLETHLRLRDAVLTLEPLNFSMAGGQLHALITLDGRQNPIQAHAKVRVKKIRMDKLLPTVDLNKNNIGEINGELDLAGQGNSIGRMLASANGKVGLVVAGGEVSQLMLEKLGLHLWEILQLSLTGDKQVRLRCAVLGFDVRQGRMQADALVFDTEVTTVIGTGSIDLGQETLNLTLNQKTKVTSPLALRSPIYIRGSFSKPQASVDTARVASRALGALALGLVNPLLALMPLVDAGPGQDSDCASLVQTVRAWPRTAHQSVAAPK
ncbi:MAG: AsmA family protein [Rhodoferax sp.]|nr:AsmA family protein [Rhodoferax sp.]MDP3651980.1 AsmA family protein [Rhodoferax sp.]